MPDRTCSLPECPKPVDTRGWCAMHYSRWRRHGDVGEVGEQRPSRAGQPRYRGDAIGYRGLHTRLLTERGPADGFACVDACGRPASTWSYDHSDPDEKVDRGLVYSVDLDRYEPRCLSCHWHHDHPDLSQMSEAWLEAHRPGHRKPKTHCVNGHEYVEANEYWDSGGYRRCLICVRRTRRESALRRRGAA